MTHRFYCPQLGESGSTRLIETEAHHLSHVLRHQPGDQVELFDGRGLAATCKITTITKREVILDVLTSNREIRSQSPLILATAVPKGDRFDWLIEKATELGVNRLIPLTTHRSVVDPRSSKLEKLRQTVISACKQSGRNDLMAISDVTTWTSFLHELRAEHRILVAHPRGESVNSVLTSADRASLPVVIAIGPEGGLTDEEVQSALSQGAVTVNLGRTLLRIETAAIALAARILI